MRVGEKNPWPQTWAEEAIGKRLQAEKLWKKLQTFKI